MTTINRAVLFSIIGLCLISIFFHFFPRKILSQKTTLHFDLFYEEKAELQHLISKFQEQNPKIEVVPVYHSYQDLAEKLINPGTKTDTEDAETNKTQTQGDLVMIDMDWLPNLNGGSHLEKKEILASLESFPKDDSDLNLLYETSNINGTFSVIPLFSNPSVFFYNIDMLSSAGFDRPPKTREDFLRYSRALKEKQIEGIAFALAEENHSGMRHSGMLGDIFSWFWNSDIFFMKDDDAPFQARQVLETLQFFDTLREEKLISSNSFANTNLEKFDAFCSGSVAMMIAPFSAMQEIKNKVQFKWNLSSVPSAVSYVGNPLFATENSGIGIYAASEEKEAAWKFLSFLASAEQNAALSQAYCRLPQNQHAELSLAESFPQLEKALDLFQAGKQVNEFDTKAGIFSAERIIYVELQKMMNGETSPEEAAKAIQERLNAQL